MIKVGVRRRADRTESWRVVARNTCSQVALEMTAWLGANVDEASFLRDYSGNDGGSVDISPALPDGLSAAMSFCPRRSISSDHGMFDDVLSLEMKEGDERYAALVSQVLPRLVTAFGAYRAQIVINEDLDLADFDEICEIAERTGRDVDGRDGVFRIGVANFFDDELCRRTFGLSADVVYERLASYVASAVLVASGVYFVVSDSLLDDAALKDIDVRVRRLLDVTGHRSPSTPD